MTDDELAILGALAETLVPTDETPGADAAWARAFVARHLARHPDEAPRFVALARHLASLGFATTSDREALLATHYPTLAVDDVHASTMRDIIAAFFLADELDLREDPYWLDGPLRDRTTATSPEYAAADAIPDLAIDRRMATNTGRGTYGRAWRAAGYPVPPGLPQPDIDRVPELVQLRKK